MTANSTRSLPVCYLPAGQIAVSGRCSTVLEAVLGSCVGVAICDRKAGVGGLAHFLLPEPSGRDLLDPGRYASTGLPAMIERLEDLGAKTEHMVASIAGGGLVGQVTDNDVRFDIGGRTADTARTILGQENILVEHSETGGYLGCNIRLDLETFKVEIAPVFDHSAGPCEPLEMPDEKQLSEAIRGVRPIPQTALKIIRMLNDGNYDWNNVGREVRSDQVISSRVLHLCNAPISGLLMEVDSIDRAVILLGENRMLQLVVSAACQDYFTQSDQGYALIRGGLFRHSVGVAEMSGAIAEATGVVPPGTGYTAGLLHDIGKIVLDRLVTKAKPLFYRKTDKDGIDLVDVENQLLGITHPKAGLQYALKMGLPRNIREVVGHHHAPEEAVFAPELTRLVHVADMLVSRYRTVSDLDAIPGKRFVACCADIGLKPAQLHPLIERITRMVF